jgi:hypothetical protein
MKGKPTKRIVCILGVKCAIGNHHTYKRELLNPRKNSNFHKTNHPGKGNNGGLRCPMEDPISVQITISRIYAHRETRSVDIMSCRGVVITLHHSRATHYSNGFF